MRTTEKIKIVLDALISVPIILINRIKFEIIKAKIKKLLGIEPLINPYGYFADYHFFNKLREKYKIEGVITPKDWIIENFGKKLWDEIQSVHCTRISLNYLKLLFKK